MLEGRIFWSCAKASNKLMTWFRGRIAQIWSWLEIVSQFFIACLRARFSWIHAKGGWGRWLLGCWSRWTSEPKMWRQTSRRCKFSEFLGKFWKFLQAGRIDKIWKTLRENEKNPMDFIVFRGLNFTRVLLLNEQRSPVNSDFPHDPVHHLETAILWWSRM